MDDAVAAKRDARARHSAQQRGHRRDGRGRAGRAQEAGARVADPLELLPSNRGRCVRASARSEREPGARHERRGLAPAAPPDTALFLSLSNARDLRLSARAPPQV